MPGNDVVARNVRRFRDERQLSMGELCRRAGLAKQTIASIEAGTGNPTIDTLERIAGALGVSSRALLTEMGTEVLVHRDDSSEWRDLGGLRLRQLDQVFGSGYVTNSIIRLDANRGASRHPAGGRGSLRHCFVIEGRARLGPDAAPTTVSVGDFVRFPAEAAHFFEAMTPVALVFVCTTAPQLTMADGARVF